MPFYTSGNNPQYVGGGGPFAVEVTLTAATTTTAGAVAAVANPVGEELIITQAIVRTTTQSTGAATLDIGVAANATTASDTLIDGLSVATAPIVLGTPGTNGLVPRVWGASQYVTATASATTAGMVGSLHLICIRA